ncbi:MAG: dTDP-glucose 4,6-dehydratase [Bdellovibrio sp.]|nr:dTDP-glucose 4,6-dehydratase [Bdellovibrio sp.]
MIFVTGGCGFIGSNFILQWFENCNEELLNIDKLTYAGNPENLSSTQANPLYKFVKMDITSADDLKMLFLKHKPRAVVHFAAESHVDRSISGPFEFIHTNIIGTFQLLEETRRYWGQLDANYQKNFRFLHVSTDEVFGSLTAEEPAFSEKTAYAPNSPYSASKASSDHLVRAYFHTYKLPTVTSNCSNNYGSYQFPEKLIPLCILNALQNKNLTIYGDGTNVRDWLYVTDHCHALRLILEKGRPGETYNVGGLNEMKNIEVVDALCKILDDLRPRKDGKSYLELKTFVRDRPGHDQRYAINADKIMHELDWKPQESFATGLSKTVNWYLQNENWIANVTSGAYQEWIQKNYGDRT